MGRAGGCDAGGLEGVGGCAISISYFNISEKLIVNVPIINARKEQDIAISTALAIVGGLISADFIK